MEIDHKKVLYMFEGLTGEMLPEEVIKTTKEFLATQNIFLSATREITTKLENLNDEFRYVKDRNPIHQIHTRIKSPKSIIEKLMRKGVPLSPASARENINDIAGVRIITSYIDDIYLIANLLLAQDDIKLVRETDYIKKPKQNGYRSLHLIVTVPVFLSASTELVKVEIQIRTIAMDFWASLEHELAYKLDKDNSEEITIELTECADVIAKTDLRMQRLYNRIGTHTNKIEDVEFIK